MTNITKEYLEGDMQVTEYDSGSIVKFPANSIITPGETLPVPPSFEQRLSALEEAKLADLGL